MAAMNRELQDCAAACRDCAETCPETVRHRLEQGAEAGHITFLLQCSQIWTSADFMTRGSDIRQRTCAA